MKRFLIYFLYFMTILSLIFINGCGGGGGGGGVSGSGVTTGSTTPSSPPNITNTGVNGYVYSAGSTRSLHQKPQGKHLVVLPTNKNIPSGFTPAAGIIVRITKNPPMIQRTDSNGYFSFGNVTSPSIGTIQNDIVVEEQNSDTPPIGMPIFGEPMSASRLSDLRIVPPYSGDSLSMRAGQYEYFFVIGKLGEEWHPVSDIVTWAVSGQNIGSFVNDYGIFLANESLASTTTGSITAKVDGKTLSVNVKVYSLSEIGTVEGYVRNKNGNPIINALIEAIPQETSENSTNAMAITDENGYYIITDLPFGTYNIDVSSFYRKLLANATVKVTGAVKLDFSTSETDSFIMASVSTDKFAYQPGETIHARIDLFNMGSGSTTLTYGSIEFKLIKSEPNAAEIPVASSVSEGGTVRINGMDNASIPLSDVAVLIPANSEKDSFYQVTAVIKTSSSSTSTPSPTPTPKYATQSKPSENAPPPDVSSPSPPSTSSPGSPPHILSSIENVSPACIIIGDEPEPIPMPFPTEGPNPMPTYQPVPGQASSSQTSQLGEIKTKLQNMNQQLISFAEKAFSGKNVNSSIDETSKIQNDLKYIRDTLLPAIGGNNVSGWKNEINSAINQLNTYVNGGSYNSIYNAANIIGNLSENI